jgi:ribosomal protein L2
MKLKMLLPRLCVVVLAAGVAMQYSASQKQEAELKQLRSESQELKDLRAAVEESKQTQASANEELVQLRKDKEDLMRLRNEVNQLRNDRQQLAKQAQAQVASATAQASQAQQQQMQQLLNENQQLRAQTQQTQQNTQAAACIANLRMIDGAVQQWAQENRKPTGSLVTAQELSPYLKGNVLPVCPAGGVYTINPVGMPSICNIPGHVVPK